MSGKVRYISVNHPFSRQSVSCLLISVLFFLNGSTVSAQHPDTSSTTMTTHHADTPKGRPAPDAASHRTENLSAIPVTAEHRQSTSGTPSAPSGSVGKPSDTIAASVDTAATISSGPDSSGLPRPSDYYNGQSPAYRRIRRGSPAAASSTKKVQRKLMVTEEPEREDSLAATASGVPPDTGSTPIRDSSSTASSVYHLSRKGRIIASLSATAAIVSFVTLFLIGRDVKKDPSSNEQIPEPPPPPGY